MGETVTYWLLLPEVWLIVGIVLIIVEILIGTAYFLLALGVAGLILSGIVFFQEIFLFGLLTDWMDVAICYGILSIVSIFIVKALVRKDSQDQDINQY
ncbi:MAG TPA: hypothetical protein EYQ22_00875 [Gammaproteobacteria bacterium]|nr:hypothetical protein [Gammaproteobacteria bacterium]